MPQGYRTACNLAIQKLLDMAVDLKDKSMDEKRSMLIRCAETTLNSKLLGRKVDQDQVDQVDNWSGTQTQCAEDRIKHQPLGSMTQTSNSRKCNAACLDKLRVAWVA